MKHQIRYLLLILVGLGILFLLSAGPKSVIEAASSGDYPLVEQSWVRLGGPLGGLGYDIRMHPDNPDLMYVTDANAGVHRSDDGGKHWYSINEGIDVTWGPSGDNVPAFCLTVDPNNPDTVWVGLQELAAVYRSDDGGLTWSRKAKGIEEPWGFSVRGITIEPGDSDVIYIAGEINSWQWAGEYRGGKMFDKVQGVVYKSTDGGNAWQKIWQGDNLARYIHVNPDEVNVLYVSTGIFDREAANSSVEENEPGGVGILKSTDGGETWNVLDEGEGLEGLYIGSLFMHPENPDILVAGAGHDYWSRAWDQGERMLSEAGVFITTDGGESWSKAASADMISSVEVCEGDPKVIYAGGDRIMMRSDDGGDTWKELGGHGWGPPGIVAGFPIDMQCDPRDSMRLFVNNYGGGNFITEDGGHTFADTSHGYTGAQVRSITIDQTQPNVVYAGGRSGLFRSIDGGFTWEGLAYEPAKHTEINALAISPADSNIVLSAPWDIGRRFARSEEGGHNWNLTHFLGGERDQQVTGVVFAPSNPERVYAAVGWVDCIQSNNNCGRPGSGLFISDDAGRTWEALRGTPIDEKNLKDIVVHPANEDVVLVATETTIFKTVDGGQRWEQLPFQREMILTLDMASTNPDLLLAGTWEGMFRSTDGGQTWTWSMNGMDFEALIEDTIFHPGDESIVWAADLLSGMYYSLDGGVSWTQHNEGLTMKAVQALAISGDGNTLYAATEGGGVFRLSTRTQDDFDALAPEPTKTPLPSTTPEPEPTATPQEIAESVVEEEEQEYESAPIQDVPTCPISFLPLVLLAGTYSIVKSRKKK